MDLQRERWGTLRGHEAEKYTVTDAATGFQVTLTDFGATLVSVKVPDRAGRVAGVNFGKDRVGDYWQAGAYFGATVGRVANRISGAKFTLDGREYSLHANNAGLHCLHGGKEGFDSKWWTCRRAVVDGDVAVVEFTYLSPDMEEGFPGNLETRVTFEVAPMRLAWRFEATTDAPTVVNLTNHAYWNLDGLDATVDGLELELLADRYMPGDENNLATGEVLPVAGTPLDFHSPRRLSDVFAEFGDVDNNFFVEGYEPGSKDPRLAARLYSPRTGRLMEVHTTEPCIQVYTGNYMEGHEAFGVPCRKHSAVCLETQRVPNAINFPEFRDSVVLRPGETYYHATVHEFSVV
ncbi:MAG: aldose epimerase family protein [Promethearchaeota archaeon]